MVAIGLLLLRMLFDYFRPRPRLEAEIPILRHQLNVLQQRTPRRRLHLRWVDRALFIWLSFPKISSGLGSASTMVANDLCDLRGASSSSISILSIFVRPMISSWRGVGIFAHALRSCRYF